jgi:hypothetical protein
LPLFCLFAHAAPLDSARASFERRDKERDATSSTVRVCSSSFSPIASLARRSASREKDRATAFAPIASSFEETVSFERSVVVVVVVLVLV